MSVRVSREVFSCMHHDLMVVLYYFGSFLQRHTRNACLLPWDVLEALPCDSKHIPDIAWLLSLKHEHRLGFFLPFSILLTDMGNVSHLCTLRN